MSSAFLGSTSGRTPQQLRAKRYLRLSRDLYVLAPGPLDLRTRVEAARLVLTDAVPCLWTAALLLRLPVDDDGQIHLARARGAPRSRRDGVRVHRMPVEDDQTHDLEGLEVTDGPRTFVDLSRYLHFEALVAVGDVVARRWSLAELERAVARGGKRKGIVQARAALPVIDPGALSPAETRARLRLHAAGFTALRHGVVIRDAAGGWIAEPDLADELARVAVQHDGSVHFASGPRRTEQDVQRDEGSRMAGWDVVVSTARDDRYPHLLVAKVTAAYQRAARLRGPDVLPAHLRQDGPLP